MGQIAGNQTADRHPQDLYPTEAAWTQVLVDFVEFPGPVWEPAAGTGDMVKVLEQAGYQVVATDITTGTDFLKSEGRYPTIVTNPPYRLLSEFITHGLRQADDFLALLVGWHFLGGAARTADIWQPHPPTDVVMIPERMKVHGKPSQFNHAWLVWDARKNDRSTHLHWRNAR